MTSSSFLTVIFFKLHIFIEILFSLFGRKADVFCRDFSPSPQCKAFLEACNVTFQNLRLILKANKKFHFPNFINHSVRGPICHPQLNATGDIKHQLVIFRWQNQRVYTILLKPLKPQAVIAESFMQGCTPLLKKPSFLCMDFLQSATVS